MEEHGGRVLVRGLPRLLDVDRAVGQVDGLDRADPLSLRVPRIVTFARVDLLGREPVPVQRRPGTLDLDRRREYEPRERTALVGELVRLEVAQPEVFPPRGFVLAPVELHHVRQHEARLLFRRPLGGLDRDAFEQAVAQSAQLLVELADLLGGHAAFQRGTWQPVPERHRFGTQALEPVAQLERGLAVLAVVALDAAAVAIERLAESARRNGDLDDTSAQRGLAQVLLARVAEERLEVLDRIALHAGDQRALDDRVQVDERAAAQQRVELDLARGVAPHQPLERGGLVRCEVVDVGAGVACARLRCEVHEALERGALLGERRGPQRRIDGPAVGAVRHVAEQVFLHAVFAEVVAFEIQEDVVGRGLRQQRQAVLGVERRLDLVIRRTAFASAQLHTGLGPDADQRFTRAARRRRHLIERGERRERVDAALAQGRDLRVRNACHVAEVVVAATTLLALRPPRAVVAVLDRLRVGRSRAREKVVEVALEQPEVRAVIVDAVSFGFETGTRRDDVHVGGPRPLDPFEQGRVHAELQDRAGFCLAGELGVAGFVGPPAETARCVHLEQEIGAARPGAVREHALVDRVGARMHRGQGRLSRQARLGAGDLEAP